MRKMIFAVSAIVLSSPLLSQSVTADTFQSTVVADPPPTSVNAAAATNTNTSSTANTPNSGTQSAEQQPIEHSGVTKLHHRKTYRKSRVSTTVAAKTPMKDQAPGENKTPAWLDNLSGNMVLTSNYVFRGVSQTENLPAVQGSLTYQFPIGLYFNTWWSNVKFVDTDATVEADAIAGWRGSFTENFSYDLNIDRYFYPGAEELAYNEFNSVFNYKIFQFGYSYSDNAFASHGPGRYYIVGINYDVPSNYTLNIEDVSVHATLAHYTLPRVAGNSYNDYSAWVCKKFKNYILTLQWTDTNGRQHSPPYDSSHIFVMLEADF